MNTAIDLRESKVSEISRQGTTVTVLFQPARLHKSDGRPGVDFGTVWLQDLRLIFSEASVIGPLPDFPVNLTSGKSVTNGETQINLFPISLKPSGQCETTFLFDDLTVEIAAREARLELLDEPLFLQVFSPPA
jgi:hypothetical protein